MLGDCSIQVRTSVLKFIEAMKSYASNPFDFMSWTKVDNSSKEIVTNLKSLISAAEGCDDISTSVTADEFGSVEDISNDVRASKVALRELSMAISQRDEVLLGESSNKLAVAMSNLAQVAQARVKQCVGDF